MTRKNRITVSLLVAALLVPLTAAAVGVANLWPGSQAGAPAPQLSGAPDPLRRILGTFDDLDFRVYTGQEWQDLHLSHSDDVIVHWPDGHTTKGLDRHIEDLKYLFTFAPDNRVSEHPVRFGTNDAEWTAVTSWLEGTFTQPMVLADGTTIPPTGKSYRLQMATIGHWNQDHVMFEEYLFWDNAEFYRQLGLAQ
jgi:hypothetical protein